MGAATSFAIPNFSGLLFVKGQESTPFSTMIGANPLTTDHVEFACGQYYAAEKGEQPAISETASMTAPDADTTTRSQITNVTQIFQKSVEVSYAKESNMGTLSGINAANQVPNPQSELAFQIQRRMAKIAADIEYTFINGVYAKATKDSEANKTTGLIPAITTNEIKMAGAVLTYWDVCKGLKAIRDNGGQTSNIVLGVDATTMLQLNYDASIHNYTQMPLDRKVNGLALTTVVTPLGIVALALIDTLPAGTAVLFNPATMAPVYQPVPGKGNFFLEPLAKTGAGEKYQIFGQVGLDFGAEWQSAKFTGISTAMPTTTTVTP